jgi:hypothetical protein
MDPQAYIRETNLPKAADPMPIPARQER